MVIQPFTSQINVERSNIRESTVHLPATQLKIPGALHALVRNREVRMSRAFRVQQPRNDVASCYGTMKQSRSPGERCGGGMHYLSICIVNTD